MSTVTTHILDTAQGRPAVGVPVVLERVADGVRLAEGITDWDGRLRELGPDDLPPGDYRLTFETIAYLGADAFYPQVSIAFAVASGKHYHVPLLLSPYGYTTYRGS